MSVRSMIHDMLEHVCMHVYWPPRTPVGTNWMHVLQHMHSVPGHPGARKNIVALCFEIGLPKCVAGLSVLRQEGKAKKESWVSSHPPRHNGDGCRRIALTTGLRRTWLRYKVIPPGISTAE